MRSLYTTVLALHVVVAVLGLGLIAAVPLVVAAGRRQGRTAAEVAAVLTPLLRYSGISLGVLLLTGAILDVAVGGALHERWWFRGSALLLFVTGALHGMTRRALRGALAAPASEPLLRHVERLAYAMCLVIAAIVVLMEAKPF